MVMCQNEKSIKLNVSEYTTTLAVVMRRRMLTPSPDTRSSLAFTTCREAHAANRGADTARMGFKR